MSVFSCDAEVTQEKIGVGVARSCGNCPIALALNAVPGVEGAAVNFVTAFAKVNGVEMRAAVTGGAFEFIKSFDAGRPVAPATFRFSFVPVEGSS